MKNVPKKIYLQVGDECDIEELDFNELFEVSWCANKIFDTDIEYMIVDQNQVQPFVSKPIFLIDTNWHPEYNIEANWREYTLDEYMQEFDLNIDCINAMMRVGRIVLKSC